MLISSSVDFCHVNVLVAQSYPTLCNPMDYTPPGSSVHGILQVRILEPVAIPFFMGSSQLRNWTQVTCMAGRFLTTWAPRGSSSVVFSYWAPTPANQVAQMAKNLPAIQDTQFHSLSQKDPLKKERATHSSILACRILHTKVPGGLQSMVLQRVRYNWACHRQLGITTTSIVVHADDHSALSLVASAGLIPESRPSVSRQSLDFT